MSKLNRILLLVGIVALCMAAFGLGRYAERLKISAVGSSYRAAILEGMLRQLRTRQVTRVALALEMRLDEEVAALARMRKQKLGSLAFVPASRRSHVEVVLKRFVDYRNTMGNDYHGAPPWQIERFENPSRELLDQLEEINRQRSKIDELVESVYDAHGGREEAPPVPAPSPDKAPVDGPAEALAKDAAETPATNSPAARPPTSSAQP